MTCKKCGSKNIVPDVEWGGCERRYYWKCLSCGQEYKIITEDEMSNRSPEYYITMTNDIINRIKECMIEKEMSVKDIKMIGKTTYYRIMHDGETTERDVIKRLAKSLRVSYQWLISGEGDKNNIEEIDIQKKHTNALVEIVSYLEKCKEIIIMACEEIERINKNISHK